MPSMIHKTPHPKAGQTVKLKNGSDFRLEDWWDRVSGQSWTISVGNRAALQYAERVGTEGLPMDDEVVYGKIGFFGHLIHVSELS